VIPLRDDNPTSRPAVVTIAIIVACALVYLLWQPTPGRATSADNTFNLQHAAIPFEIRHGRPLERCDVLVTIGRACATTDHRAIVPGKNVWLSALVSMFMHGNILHIAGNMLFLWVFGNNVEDRLGRVGFLAFYLLAGVIALLAHVAAGPSSMQPVVGASGAIAGVMGAYLVWWPRAKVSTLFFVFVVFWFRIQARWLLLAWFVLQFFTSPNSNVAWVAHVGGFLFGVVVALLLRPKRASPLHAVS
jgi:membrane associated rhomboid family serine protease